jgi:hypothetical protein
MESRFDQMVRQSKAYRLVSGMAKNGIEKDAIFQALQQDYGIGLARAEVVYKYVMSDLEATA